MSRRIFNLLEEATVEAGVKWEDGAHFSQRFDLASRLPVLERTTDG